MTNLNSVKGKGGEVLILSLLCDIPQRKYDYPFRELNSNLTFPPDSSYLPKASSRNSSTRILPNSFSSS